MIKKETKPITKTTTTSTSSTTGVKQASNQLSKPVVKTNTTSAANIKPSVTNTAKTIGATKSISQPQQPKNEAMKDDKILKTHYIKISIQKATELDNKIKDLNNLLKVKAEKVDLILDTKFESDNALLNFSTSLIKVAGQINYLKWIIKGSFTDDGQAKCIGDTIGKFSQAYRIELQLDQTFFADRGAKSLGIALKKLINTHVLRIQINIAYGRVAKNLTGEGIEFITNSVSQMPKLEIYESNLRSHEFTPPKNISNIVYDLVAEYRQNIYSDGDMTDAWKEAFTQFVDLMNSYNGRLTTVAFKRYRSGDQISKDSCMMFDDIHSIEEIEAFFLKQVKYLYDLPYITQFDYTFDEKEHLIEYPDSKNAAKISCFNNILSRLAKSRLTSITSIAAYKSNIQQFLNINPIMVLTDLWIQ